MAERPSLYWKPMIADQVRSTFLDFFQANGHHLMPSSSLVPLNDPTVLLTPAGMHQMQPFFLGKAKPPAPRLASCQKCFRTTDIESVGERSPRGGPASGASAGPNDAVECQRESPAGGPGAGG